MIGRSKQLLFKRFLVFLNSPTTKLQEIPVFSLWTLHIRNGFQQLRKMYRDEQKIQVELTREEALSLFLRCLNSNESDSPEIVSALRKLGHVLEGGDDERQLLAS